MSRFRPKLEEGWTALALLLLMLLTVVGSAVAADWTKGLTVLPWIVVVAVVVGTALAKLRRIPTLLAHLLGLTLGAGSILGFLVVLFQPPLVPQVLSGPIETPLGRAGLVWEVGLQWLAAPAGSEPWVSNFMFVAILTVLAWILSYVGAWFVFRAHWAWGAVVPAGIACILNIYYAPPRLVFYLMLYCILALLLVVRVHVYTRQRTWRREEVNYNLDVDLTFLRDGMLVSVLALALAWSVPSAAQSPRLTDFWGSFQDTGDRVRTLWNQFFTSLNYQGRSTLVEFGRTMVLGGAVNLANVPILDVYAQEPHYWRAVSYDTYTGSSWIDTDASEVVLLASSQVLNPAPYAAQRVFTHTVQMLEPGENLLFLAGQPLSATLSARASLTYVATGEGQPATDVSMLTALRTLGRDQSYTVSAMVSRASAQQLRAAGTEYPEWVKARYLQLPTRLPGRVRTLSRQLTELASTPYDAAEAIQSYLRRITYDQFIAAPPPGDDVVDWFLFVNRRGYCDYYATAMAVLCRASGIPARISQGYTPGELDSDLDAYRVRQLDAHAWPEVYFPHYGWIAFEPTSSEPVLSRLQEGEAGLLAGILGLPGATLSEEEDKYGPDEALLEDAALIEVAVAQSNSWFARFLGLALALAGVLFVVVLGVVAWWAYSLRGLSVAASVYEQMRRLGRLLGARCQEHQTPAEYGESLAKKVAGGRQQIQRLMALYVKQCFGREGLSATEETEAAETWPGLRALMLRRALAIRRPKRRTRSPRWVPASSLRPPGTLQ